MKTATSTLSRPFGGTLYPTEALTTPGLPSAAGTAADMFAPAEERPLKYTFCITQRCNLACPYCYVTKTETAMTWEMARKIVAFIFRHADAARAVEFGFFGGEPLLEFGLLKRIVEHIEQQPAFDADRMGFSLTTNGTVFSDEIADFFNAHHVKVCISCDGPPHVQDLFRRTKEQGGSSAMVERTLRAALDSLPTVLVNAVFHPQTLRLLPETVDYFSSLGLRQIYLNADFSAPWTLSDAEQLSELYDTLGRRFIAWYLRDDPHFISLIDSKLAVLLRHGYQPAERCQMGKGEMGFTADGGIYPCERLIGDGVSGAHRIGTVERGLDLSQLTCQLAPGGELNRECLACELKNYCMNWCGCSNSFITGFYNRVGPFLCASEKNAIRTALNVFEVLEQRLGPRFLHHVSGQPQLNSRATTGAPPRKNTVGREAVMQSEKQNNREQT